MPRMRVRLVNINGNYSEFSIKACKEGTVLEGVGDRGGYFYYDHPDFGRYEYRSGVWEEVKKPLIIIGV